MKFYNATCSLLMSFLVGLSLIQYFMIESIIFIWVSVLIAMYTKNKNSFISMLLILEMFSLVSLFVSGAYTKMSSISTLMFILMTLSVGEAVLGLAILVKLVRWNSSEFLLGGLN